MPSDNENGPRARVLPSGAALGAGVAIAVCGPFWYAVAVLLERLTG